MYHFRESSKSVEIFTGWMGGGVGFGGHQGTSPVELSVPLFIFGQAPDKDDSNSDDDMDEW